MNPFPNTRTPRTWRAATLIATAPLIIGGGSSNSNADARSTKPVTATEQLAGANTNDPAQAGSLFDGTTVHTLAVTADQGALDEMLTTYDTDGEKTWIEASITIDGKTYDRVGLRLKGNSSLRVASDAAAEDLPWLIRLDKFVDGQTHDGHEDIVVRSNNTQTSLNEAVALDLLAEAGLPSQASAPTRFSVNNSDETLRLIIEHPDDDGWYESVFSGPGAIYKSESTGDWSYRGDDPDSYEEVFDQEGGSDVADLSPLIALLKFINESDDATFEAELADHLDVDAFATYLAMTELVDNFDDIDGPGNNSYLWWDAETERFTIVPWDLNLAFGGSPRGDMGEGGGPGMAPGGQRPDSGEMPTPPQGETSSVPQGGQPPSGGPGFGRSNVLVERFQANEKFKAEYEQRLEELRSELFDGGPATEILEGLTRVLLNQATDLVDEPTIRSESEAIATRLA